VPDSSDQIAVRVEAILDQKDEVGEVPYARTGAVPVGPGEGVELLSEVLGPIDDLDVSGGHTGEGDGAGKANTLRPCDLAAASQDVEPHSSERPTPEGRCDADSPAGPTRLVDLERLRLTTANRNPSRS
jgi:hypothetical protein